MPMANVPPEVVVSELFIVIVLPALLVPLVLLMDRLLYVPETMVCAPAVAA